MTDKTHTAAGPCRFCGNPCVGEWGEDFHLNMWGVWHPECGVPSPVPPKTLAAAIAQQRTVP